MEIGKLGVFAMTEFMTAQEAAAFAKRVERWGYGALWLPEAIGRNGLVHSAWLLARTERLVVATGIANIYARDPVATAAAQYTLAEQSGNRFLLGLGVSHAPLVEGVRGQTYSDKPVATMRAYLEAMARFSSVAVPPSERPETVLAALGPRMLALAATHADGAHPYNVTPDHTAQARAILGPGKRLCPEQMVLLETDPGRARAAARAALGPYLTLSNYLNNFRRMGFTDEDFAEGGSDRLIDGVIAWGDEAAIRARIQAHWDAGADHVCIQALPTVDAAPGAPDEALLELLAPAG
jgi:probable F420-dependent oxidoreductase